MTVQQQQLMQQSLPDKQAHAKHTNIHIHTETKHNKNEPSNHTHNYKDTSQPALLQMSTKQISLKFKGQHTNANQPTKLTQRHKLSQPKAKLTKRRMNLNAQSAFTRDHDQDSCWPIPPPPPPPQGTEWYVIYSTNTLCNTALTICYNYTMINGTMPNTTPKYMQITHTSHTVDTLVQRTVPWVSTKHNYNKDAKLTQNIQVHENRSKPEIYTTGK